MDIRDCCSDYKWWESHNGRTAIFNDEEVSIEMKVCDVCEGRGSYVNPSIDAHGISGHEFDEDPDFAESYFQGVYDVTCSLCGGKNVVPYPTDPKIQEQVEAWFEEQSYYRSECESERRMGA